MTFTVEDMRRVAELSRLEISDEELTLRMEELSRVLGYVERLSHIDTAGVPEGGTAPERTMWRDDVIVSADASVQQQIIENFPDHAGAALRVHAVFEKPKGSYGNE